MITCIRDIRRSKGLTLAEVAVRCIPPTTAQTIGRLETGTRTVSVGWLNRIAAALEVPTTALVHLPDEADPAVAALLRRGGAQAPAHATTAPPPRPPVGAVAVLVEEDAGDYRAGDAIWCERLAPPDFARAAGRDILAPGKAGRFHFGRMIGLEDGRLVMHPLAPGARQAALGDLPWIAVAAQLVRKL